MYVLIVGYDHCTVGWRKYCSKCANSKFIIINILPIGCPHGRRKKKTIITKDSHLSGQELFRESIWYDLEFSCLINRNPIRSIINQYLSRNMCSFSTNIFPMLLIISRLFIYVFSVSDINLHKLISYIIFTKIFCIRSII